MLWILSTSAPAILRTEVDNLQFPSRAFNSNLQLGGVHAAPPTSSAVMMTPTASAPASL